MTDKPQNDIVSEIKTSFDTDKNAWNSIYKKAKEDLHFLSDEVGAQWDQRDFNDRIQTGRPALTIDHLGQFIHQTANDIRMNTPSIEVIPSNTEASEDVAEVYKGLIREIEYYSNADDVYDTASLSSIRCSIGFMRVDFEYDGNGFDQRLCIKRIINPLSVFIDAGSIECDGRDAKRGTILEKISVKQFKSKYPDMAIVSFDENENKANFVDDDFITIAEHFVINEDVETITSPDGELTRDITKKSVKRYKLSGQDVLEEGTFPGEYIPLVPVYGEEAWIDGKRNLFSLIRKAKPAQQMLNYWKSLETELLKKAPKAPIMVAAGQIEDYVDDWQNPDKAMALRYNPKDAENNLVGPPQVLPPPQISPGIINASQGAVNDIKASMGIYNAGLGQIGNEISGIAIRQKQQEGDVATFHFQDNLTRSITQVGRILVSAIPEVYSNERVIRILGLEDQPEDVGINGALALNQAQSIDLAQGRYQVKVKTGGSYTTRRQEAAEFLSTLVSSSPEMMKIVGDLMFDNMDFSGANKMAERIRKVMDPAILEESDDPRVSALTSQLQQMQAAMQQMQVMLDDKQADLQIKAQGEANDAQEARTKAELEVMKLRLEEQKQTFEAQAKQQELALRERELYLKEQELILESQQGRELTISNV